MHLIPKDVLFSYKNILKGCDKIFAFDGLDCSDLVADTEWLPRILSMFIVLVSIIIRHQQHVQYLLSQGLLQISSEDESLTIFPIGFHSTGLQCFSPCVCS